MSEGREDRAAQAIGKIGTVGGIGSILTLIAVAASVILSRFMNVEMEILSIIAHYGPGVASVLGMASSFATYYGWFRVVRRKRDLDARGEGKSEAQNQFGDFIQSLPDIISSIGCFQNVATIALGASLVASAATYTPFGELITKKVKEAIEDMRELKETKPKEEDVPEEKETTLNIIGKLYVSSKEEGETLEETVAILVGRRGWSNVTIELLRDGDLIATSKTDEEGEYAFMDMPLGGEYKVKAKLAGYREVHREEQGKWDLELVAEEMEEPEYEEIAAFEMPNVILEPELSDRELRVLARKRREAYGAPPRLPPAPTPPWQLALPSSSSQPLPPAPLRASRRAPPVKKETNSGFFAGLGSELNNNAQKGVATGNNIELGYDVNKHFALGVNAVYSSDMDNKENTMESAVVLRYYLPYKGPFLQAEAGGSMNKGEKNNIAPQAGAAAGWRLNVDKELFVEPAVRGGYPVIWGAGVTVGKKFGRD